MFNTTKKNPIQFVRYPNEVVYEFSNYDQLLHYWPIIAKYRDIGHGFKHTAEDIAAIRAHLLGNRIRPRYPIDVCWGDDGPLNHHQYAIRDSFGDFLDPNDVRADYNKRHPHIPKWRRAGQRRGAYGRFRKIRTIHERRWTGAWDDEDYAPKSGFARGSRTAHSLPDPWDDYWSHNDKSWKTQSNRKHQWNDK